MSDIPYIAIDAKQEINVNDNVFSGTGQVVVPFNMVEITGYAKFSDFKLDEHIFVSVLPCFDGQYWCFYFKGTLAVDRSQTEVPYYYQNDKLNDGTDYTFYYTTTRKPLQISSINLNNKVLPYTYASRQIRTGIIDGVNILDSQNNSDIMYNFDNQYSSLSLYELQCMFAENRNYNYQVDQMTFNGDFIDENGTIKYVWTDDEGNIHYFNEEGEDNGNSSGT